MRFHGSRLIDHRGGVQQRLGGDTTHVQTDAAQLRVAFNQCDTLPQVCGSKRRCVAARAGAEPVVAADPSLTGHPALASAVARWASDDLLDFVDKG